MQENKGLAGGARVSILVLAAGGGRRMGGDRPKLLLPLPGEPGVTVLGRTLGNALAAGFPEVLCVLGPQVADFVEVVRRIPPVPGLRVVRNPRHEAGRGESIRAGVLHRNPHVEHLLILCGDQPGIGPGLLRRLVTFHLQADSPVSFPVRSDGGRGYPVIWARALFPGLERLEGDRGARPLLQKYKADAGRLPLTPQEEAAQADLDTPEDYETWPNRIGI